MTIRRRIGLTRRLHTAALAAVIVWLVYAAASVHSVQALRDMLNEHTDAAVSLLRLQLQGTLGEEDMPAAVAFLAAQSPLFHFDREDTAAENPEEEPPPQQQTAPPATEKEPTPSEFEIVDNGVSARTLVPASSQGYIVTGAVYVDNRSDRTVDTSLVSGNHSLTFADTDSPQVLIIHTHGSEAYTMPPGEEYVASGDCRTTDEAYSVVRVGEELAAVLEQAGISVLHDKTLHDHPRYSGAYERSLKTVERYLQRYPTIQLVLDIHRDAISDAQGNICKIVSNIGGVNAAQLCFIVGTDGGGASHPNWQENLKLASALQETLCSRYPTLMRPVTVRNSRYNQHAAPYCLLVEVGAAGNSLYEAIYSAKLLGEAIVSTVQVRNAELSEVVK